MGDDTDDEQSFFADLAGLCSERLNQMTKTYDDLEAVTQLLEEKEKDLELAAKIGKSLLERNKELQQTNEYLEEQLNYATDQVTQLKHELQQKIDLLHIYTESESADSGGSTPAGERLTNWGFLQSKLRILEEENLSLKLETNHLKTLTQGLEEKEQQLLNDCMKEIGDYNGQVTKMGAELIEKQEQCEDQQKQVNRLRKELAEKSNSEKLLRVESEELTVRLRAAQQTQAELAQELLDLQERYAEVVAMLTESKEELKQMREKATSSRFGTGSNADDSYYDSLASELEASDSGYSGTCGGRRYYDDRNTYKNEALRRSSQDHLIKVMETVRNSLQRQESELEKWNTAGKESHSKKSTEVSSAGAGYDEASARRSCVEKAKGMVEELETALSPVKEEMSRTSSNDSLCSYPAPSIGVPGIPGTKDLEFAIRRLSLRRRVELEFDRYQREKGHTPSSFFTPRSPLSSTSRSTPFTHPPCPNPCQSRHSFSSPIRARLMLVKPVEGSETMAQWRRLATPGGIDASCWTKRPGIKVRGGNGGSPPLPTQCHDNVPCTSIAVDIPTTSRDPELETSSTSRRASSIVGQFSPTPGVFSFVDSQILHPAESRANVNTAPVLTLSASPPHDDGTATFSTAMNLAQALGERCVNLVTGISSGWLASRRSPMTIPAWSSSMPISSTAPASSSMSRLSEGKDCPSCLAAPADSVIAGLKNLVGENESPDLAAAVETSGERRHSHVSGVVMRSDLKLAKEG